MSNRCKIQYPLIWLSIFFVIKMSAQIEPGVYFFEELINEHKIQHELKIDSSYFVYSIFKKEPAEFIKTKGGPYTIENKALNVKLEFNSDYEKDSISGMRYSLAIDGDKLILLNDQKLIFVPKKVSSQELDGLWLFGTRGPDNGQERRGDTNPRKTLKFLQNGRFQWIAFNTETMKFHGTGGGSFTSKNGVYQESIEYFSRDNSRVGAVLTFDYTLEGNDWHHKGKNSKGEPMYEIWARRY